MQDDATGPFQSAVWRPYRHDGEAWARIHGQMAVRLQRSDSGTRSWCNGAHTGPRPRPRRLGFRSHPQRSSPPAPVTATSPERPRRVLARPDEVSTGSRPSGIIGGIMGHDPVAMAFTACRAVRLYISIARQSEVLLKDRRGVKKLFTLHLNLHVSLPAAPHTSLG